MSPRQTIILVLSGFLLFLQNGLSWGQAPAGSAPTVSAEDRQFILDAAQSGLHEVRMAMLGVEHGTNTGLKVYAQGVLDDHALSNAQVEALARLKGIAFPDPTKTDDTVVRLSRLTGLEFDQAFVRQEIDDHLKTVAEFEREDQSATADPDIKGYAHSALPKMHMHLEQAKALKP